MERLRPRVGRRQGFRWPATGFRAWVSPFSDPRTPTAAGAGRPHRNGVDPWRL